MKKVIFSFLLTLTLLADISRAVAEPLCENSFKSPLTSSDAAFCVNEYADNLFMVGKRIIKKDPKISLTQLKSEIIDTTGAQYNVTIVKNKIIVYHNKYPLAKGAIFIKNGVLIFTKVK